MCFIRSVTDLWTKQEKRDAATFPVIIAHFFFMVLFAEISIIYSILYLHWKCIKSVWTWRKFMKNDSAEVPWLHLCLYGNLNIPHSTGALPLPRNFPWGGGGVKFFKETKRYLSTKAHILVATWYMNKFNHIVHKFSTKFFLQKTHSF